MRDASVYEERRHPSSATWRICGPHDGLENLGLVDGGGATKFGAEMTAQDDADAALAGGAADLLRERLVATPTACAVGSARASKKRSAVPSQRSPR